MRPGLRRTLVWVPAGMVLVAAVAFAFRPQPVPVDLGAVERGPLSVTVDDEGETRVRDVYVVSTPLDGRVLRIDGEVGDQVTAGDTVLATIEPRSPEFLDIRTHAQAEAEVHAAEAALRLAQAERTRAEAELEFAMSDLRRARELANVRSVISQRELERAELLVRTREAEFAMARANERMQVHDLETAEARLIDPTSPEARRDIPQCCIELPAPVSGQILRVLHESEGVVTAGEPLLEIGNPRDLEIVVDLLSTDAVRVSTGAEVRIEDWGGEGVLHGRVRRVEPYGFTKVSALGIEEQRVNVVIDIVDPPAAWQALGHGYRVETGIVTWQADDVVLVPVSALFRQQDLWAVFAVVEGRARLTPVEIGHRNSRLAEVLNGLESGASVILHPSDRVVDNVRIVAREIATR